MQPTFHPIGRVVHVVALALHPGPHVVGAHALHRAGQDRARRELGACVCMCVRVCVCVKGGNACKAHTARDLCPLPMHLKSKACSTPMHLNSKACSSTHPLEVGGPAGSMAALMLSISAHTLQCCPRPRDHTPATNPAPEGCPSRLLLLFTLLLAAPASPAHAASKRALSRGP